MGVAGKLLIVALIVFGLGYMGYLGSGVEQATHNIVLKLKAYVNTDSSGTEVQLITPEPTEPVKIDAQYTGQVILPIDVRLKLQPGDIVTISFEKLLNSEIGLTNWKLRSVSNFHLWVSQKTLDEAKKYNIKIGYYLSGNTRIGFKIEAPPSYPDNKTPYIEFVGAIGFYTKGFSIKDLITGGKSQYKLAFVIRDVETGKTIKVPILVVEGSVQGILSSENTDIQQWLRNEDMVSILELHNNGW